MSNTATRLHWLPTPSSYVSLLILLITITIGWLLPPSYGDENGLVEWTQVGVLSLAALIGLFAFWQTRLAAPRRKLYTLSSVGILLAVARELSWGRDFYMTNSGYIPPLRQLWYGAYVYPAIALVLIGAISYFFWQGLHKEFIGWLRQDTLPAFDLAIVLIAIIIADTVEHHSFGFFGARTELFEELWELASYTGVLSFMINIVFNTKFSPQTKTNKKED